MTALAFLAGLIVGFIGFPIAVLCYAAYLYRDVDWRHL